MSTVPGGNGPDDPSGARHRAHLDDIARLARPLEASHDLDPLLARIGDRPYVLLGEASHGTSDYYRWRAEITRRLIAEGGGQRPVGFVAVEGDWPDCFEVNRWVKGLVDGPQRAADVLAGFERWPSWMWANHEVAEFLDWLREHNAGLPTDQRVGFYGLDVYSLWDSMAAIMEYLGEHDPASLETARAAYRCFDPYHEDPQAYAWATRVVPDTCEDAVIGVLRALRERPNRDGDDELRFDADQNAVVAVNAERYYRAMVRGGGSSWNVRDTHMADTLDRLMARHGPRARGVVWEHNTHIGDARATPMAEAGMVNIGQLVRQRHGEDAVVLVGFGGHHGSVIAGRSWGAPLQRVEVPPARPGTHEDLISSAVGGAPCLLVFDDDGRHDPARWLGSTRGHRAIGVVYDVERAGNWVPTILGRRYDAVLHLHRTEALHPLHAEPAPGTAELATHPSNR